jgi:hypothetical protein
MFERSMLTKVTVERYVFTMGSDPALLGDQGGRGHGAATYSWEPSPSSTSPNVSISTSA